MQITLDITDSQAKLLKDFYKKQHSGAKDNLGTYCPLHCVQSLSIDYIETQEYDEDELILYNKKAQIEATTGEEYYRIYADCNCISVDIPMQHPYQGDLSYLQENNIPIQDIIKCKKVSSYETVAIFFILDEAKEYIKKQSHNLNKPRTFTCSPGYSNEGSFVEFWNLLQTAGKKLCEH